MPVALPPNSSPLRRRTAQWVESDAVQRFVLIVIIINAATLGMQTSPWLSRHLGDALHILDLIALGIFVVEIVLKLFAYRLRFFTDGWNVFDFIIIAIALVPASGPFTVLRSLRILRVMRLVNRMPKLRFVVEALLKAMPGIGAIAGLMALIFYVSAAMATSLFGRDFPQWFGSIAKSLYSLFQIMTLESWSMGIVRPVMERFPYAWAFFVPFILASAFTMLNLFIAVIVDTMQNLHRGTDDAPDAPDGVSGQAESDKANVGADAAETSKPTGSRVGGYTPEAFATASGQEALMGEIKALRAEVAAIRRESTNHRDSTSIRDEPPT